MSDYLYEGTIRSPDELMAIADYRKTRIEELEAANETAQEQAKIRGQESATVIAELKQRLEAVEAIAKDIIKLCDKR